MNSEKPLSRKNENMFRVLVISLAHFCHDLYTSFLAPLLPLLIEKYSLTYTSAGFISVVLRFPSLFNAFFGSVIEKFNARYFVIAAPLVTSIAMSLMGAAPCYPVILLLALVTGISSSFFHVPTPVILSRSAGSRVGAAMSSFQIGGELSRTAGPVVAVAAVTAWSLEGMYRLIIPGALMSLVLYWNLRHVPGTAPAHGHRIGGSIGETFRAGGRLFPVVGGILLSKSLTATVLGAYLPAWLTSKGNTLLFSGTALSILQGAAVAGVMVTGTISDRIGYRKILVVLTMLTPVNMMLFLHTTGVMFIVSLMLLGFSSFSSTPVFLAMIQRRNFAYPSIANGLFMTINFAFSSSMILLSGYVSDLIGLEKMFFYCACLSVVGIPFAFMISDE